MLKSPDRREPYELVIHVSRCHILEPNKSGYPLSTQLVAYSDNSKRTSRKGKKTKEKGETK